MDSETGEIGSVRVESFECDLKASWLCIDLQGMRSHICFLGRDVPGFILYFISLLTP